MPTSKSIDGAFVHHNTLSRDCVESLECLLAFLQSQNASAAVGHWLSLLLQAAELEALRGHRGSANLRKEAFLTLRVLVAKVGTADALAFFLLGVVRRFAKALYVSKNMISGAAGSSVAIEQAICGLIEFLIIVLDDKANLHSLEMPVNDIGSLSPMENKSTQSVLEALRSLPLNGHVQSANMTGDSFNQAINDDHKRKIVDHSNGKRNLFVHRSKEWIDETSSNVDKLMSAAFPHLCIHSAEKVRKALVDGIQGLLLNCRCTLQRSKLILLECLCVLVCDDADVVSMVAQESLESLFVLGGKFITKNEISDIFTSLIKVLPCVVLGSDETIALSHAQKLLSLVYYAGPDLLVNYLQSPMRAVSSELEVLGRHQHPNLTIPFLKAVGEIAKASQTEASSLPDQTEIFSAHVSSKILIMQKWINENHVDSSSFSMCTESQALEIGSVNFDDVSLHLEYWEELLFKFNEMKRYRRIVGSLVGSCLKAASPLVSSQKESACLVSLDIY
ncbi:uncharacterized protein LOC135620357 isoform X3 [Musa acuminata AAA Group]|uniref:uncharacterized protein LOC135620357 isoform X3 n=1 Tax=Musa acuminata AAA Group TaxID=214697 RepID=UPI0031DEEDEE